MKNKKAFTLIELLVVMGVISVLVGMSVFGISLVLRNQRDTERRAAGQSIQLALQSYRNSVGRYPQNIFKSTSGTAIELRNGSTVVESITLEGAQLGVSYCYQVAPDTFELGVEMESGTFEQFGSGGLNNCNTETISF